MKTENQIHKDLGIVLIHGAGLGGFIWEDLIPYMNYPTLAIEFPNRNGDVNANARLRFEDYVQKAISDTINFDKRKLVLVSHSIGGLVGLRIAEYFKENTVGFIAIGGAISKNGNSFVSCLPFPQKLILPIILRLVGTKPPKSAIEKGLCNDLKDVQTETVIQNFTTESKHLYTDKSNTKIPETNKLYIQLTKDKEFPTPTQKQMAENLKCQNIASLESGHLPMMNMPEKLSEILNEFIYDCSDQKLNAAPT